MQGVLTVRRKAHNLEIGGSSPLPALIVQRGGYQRNLLHNNIRQGRSADPFLLTNGIFEKFHIKV